MNTEYTWTDAQKKSVKSTASQYVDYVMTWIENQMDDNSIFPSKSSISD